MINAEKRRRVLTIDGGGIRCLMAIEILRCLEQRLAERTGNTRFRLGDYFDLVAGTSGGAMIAAAVALGLPVHEIRDFVVANARAMFAPARWPLRWWRYLYDKRSLERNLMDWFGRDTALGSDRLITRLLLVLRNASTDSAWLLSNVPTAPYNDRGRDDCNLDLKLWQVARASAAAPVLYEPESVTLGRRAPYRFVFFDGGLTGYNNPTFKTFLFATTGVYGLAWPANERDLHIVSIGAGHIRKVDMGLAAEDVNYWYHARSLVKSIIIATEREQDLLCRTFGRCVLGDPIDKEVGDMMAISTAVEPRLFTYYRLNPTLTPEGLAAIGCGHIDARTVQKMDAVDAVEQFTEIGRAIAERYLSNVLDEGAGVLSSP